MGTLTFLWPVRTGIIRGKARTYGPRGPLERKKRLLVCFYVDSSDLIGYKGIIESN